MDISTLEELPGAANQLLKACSGRKIFAFLGEMGSGKTTLIGAICRQLGVTDKVTSPTFAIVNEYFGKEKIFHFDLFRLKTVDEALDIGIEEYFSADGCCFIEWPQVIGPLLPEETVYVTIEVIQTMRRMTVQFHE
jgi:tRNA threonylcarbamoyladenosine biosynthesis protein TsaE